MSRAAQARQFSVSALVLVSALATLGGAGGAPERTQGRERIAYVSVIDAKTRQPLVDLPPEAFVIREDGVRREVLRVTPATSPMPVAVILDNSQAAAPTIPDLRKAVAAFIKGIDGVGPIGLFTVADRPTIVQEYTTSQKDLLDAANRIFHAPSSGATLLDTIADVSKGLARRESDRAAVVVVTGENIEYGNLHYVDVLNQLRSSGAMMYTVVLVNPKGTMGSDEARNRATVLDRGPRESGGMRIDVLTSMSFEAQLKVFADMLKAQYRVTYNRPEALIQPERFQVSAAKPNMEAYGAQARGQEKK